MAAKTKPSTPKLDEGSYYALKGFAYQFDKTLIEVLTNPHATIRFENQQDIDYEAFVLQVKHKETQQYSPSKVRKPVESLMEVFSQDVTKCLLLYCHFSDKAPADWRLTLADLDAMISDDAKERYPKPIREKFLDRFMVRFSENYEEQFQKTITLIKSSFTLPDIESAVLYHSIFRSKLWDRGLRPRQDRQVSLHDLRGFLQDAEVTVFQTAYSKHLGKESYAKLIKKRYFTFTLPNIENFERLFVLECDCGVSLLELSKCVTRVSQKFCRKGKSRPPYVVFRNLPVYRFWDLKQDLFDQGTRFFDGTHFDGDRFRLDELAAKPKNESAFTIKLVPEHELPNLLQKVEMKEVFQFFIDEPLHLDVLGAHRRIQVERTEQVLQMIT